jgi:hypothetical protein
VTALERFATTLLRLYLVTPKRRTRTRARIVDALAKVGRRDPEALGRALHRAGFRADHLHGEVA